MDKQLGKIKMELRKRIKENLDKIVILDAHPKLGYTCTFNNDFLTVHYHDIMGKEFSSATYTLDDYQKQWDFETPDYYDSKSDENITAAELLAITENALNEKADKFAKAVNVCVNDIVEDITLNVRCEAEKGRTEYTSKVTIIGNKYLDKSITDDATSKNFVTAVFTKLKDYYEAKGFYVDGDTNNSGTCESTFTVIWQSVNEAGISHNKNNKELEDSEDLIHEPIQDNMSISYTNSLYADVKCPYCGVSHFEELTTYQTLVYVPRIFKDGKMVEVSNPNVSTTKFKCLDCGREFEIKK